MVSAVNDCPLLIVGQEVSSLAQIHVDLPRLDQVCRSEVECLATLNLLGRQASELCDVWVRRSVDLNLSDTQLLCVLQVKVPYPEGKPEATDMRLIVLHRGHFK